MGLVSEYRALDRGVFVLTAARVVVTAGFSMVMPFLAIYLAVERHVAAVTVGAIWTIAGACGALAQWLAGELADRVGRRPLMLASMVLRILNLAAMGWATAVEAPVVVLGALTVANSVLRSFFEPVAHALVADLSPPEKRVAAYSLQRVGINLGWGLGPAIAALLGGHGYAALFFWSVPVTILATIGVAAIPVPPRAAAARAFTLRELLAFRDDAAFTRYLAATFLFFLLQVQLFQTLSIFAAAWLHLSRSQIGLLYTVNGLLVGLLQLPASSYVVRRLGLRAALIVGSLGYAASYALVGLAHGFGGLVACVVAITLAEVVIAPAQQATVPAMAPEGRVGAYSGLYGLSQVVGQTIGPVVGTAVLDVAPARATWPLLALFGVAAAVGFARAVAPRGAFAMPLAERGKA